MKLPASLYFTLWGLALLLAWFAKSQRIDWLLYAAAFGCLMLATSGIRGRNRE